MKRAGMRHKKSEAPRVIMIHKLNSRPKSSAAATKTIDEGSEESYSSSMMFNERLLMFAEQTFASTWFALFRTRPQARKASRVEWWDWKAKQCSNCCRCDDAEPWRDWVNIDSTIHSDERLSDGLSQHFRVEFVEPLSELLHGERFLRIVSKTNKWKPKVWRIPSRRASDSSYLHRRRQSFVSIFGTIARCNHQVVSAFGFTI